MAKLFVSYSRKDSVAARKLIDSFKSIDQEVWVDWESIPPAVDWLEQIFRGIEEADAFIFMVSPDSIASEVCKVEIGRAVLNNKRVIPIVLRDVNPKDAPESIRKLNWTFIREGDNFEEGLAKIKTAIELDLDWLEEHRRLQVRALEWHRRKDASLLLRGRDLRNATDMVRTYTSKDPTPTDLQIKYIEHSRQAERNRTIAWVATAVAVIALAILSYTTFRESVAARASEAEAVVQKDEAVRQKGLAEDYAALALQNQQKAEKNAQEALAQKILAEKNAVIAEAQRSAARGQIYQTRTGELYTSTLLAIDSWKKTPSNEAEELLRENISLLPVPVAQAYQNESIDALEVSPAGDTFLTASTDGSVCVRNLKDGKPLFCTTSQKSINDAIFIQGGKSIVTADAAGAVKILSATDGSVQREFQAGSSVRDLDAVKGNELAIARENGNITILNVDELDDKGYTVTLTGKLTVASLSPDGHWAAAGSDTGTITVWNLETGQILSGARHKGAVLALRFSPNSRFLISGGADNYAVGFDTQLNQQVFQQSHPDWVRDVAFAPSGSWFATASDDGAVRVWDLFSGREQMTMFQQGAILKLRISPDGKWIASTGEDNTVRVWNAYSGVQMFQVPLAASGTAIAFNNDNDRLIASDEKGNTGIWDISGIVSPLNYVALNKMISIAKYTPSESTFIAATTNQVWLLDPGDLADPQNHAVGDPTFELKNNIRALVISPDSEWIAISTAGDEYMIYSLKTRLPVRLKPAGEAEALAFSADSSRLVTATTDGIVETWDTKTGKAIHSFEDGDPILALAVGRKGIAAATRDKIILLDANAEQKMDELQSPGENQLVAFNADASLLASANSSGQVEIWKLNNEKYTLQSTVSREQPYSMTFAPKSNVLAVGTTDNAYLIDADTGEEFSRIPHHGIIYNVSFTPDGKTLATSALKLIQLWEVSALPALHSTDLVSAACSRLIQNFSRSEWTVMFGSELPYVELCENLTVPD